MTVGTLVIIILAIIVLVVVAFGFMTGWQNLWEKIGLFTPKVNVDTMKQACQTSCGTESKYDFCCTVREVRFSKDSKPEKLTCNDDNLKGDCTITCDLTTQCANALCSNGDVVAQADCKAPKKIQSSATFSKEGIVIVSGNVCCVA